MSEYVIPFRILSEDGPVEDKWCLVHCGFPFPPQSGGWGYHNAARREYVWFNDVEYHLGFPIQQQYSRAQLEELADMLRPLLAKRDAEFLARVRANPPQFTKFVLPRFNRPLPNLRSIFADTQKIG